MAKPAPIAGAQALKPATPALALERGPFKRDPKILSAKGVEIPAAKRALSEEKYAQLNASKMDEAE